MEGGGARDLHGICQTEGEGSAGGQGCAGSSESPAAPSGLGGADSPESRTKQPVKWLIFLLSCACPEGGSQHLLSGKKAHLLRGGLGLSVPLQDQQRSLGRRDSAGGWFGVVPPGGGARVPLGCWSPLVWPRRGDQRLQEFSELALKHSHHLKKKLK